MPVKDCSFAGCVKPAGSAHGLCYGHCSQRRNGKTLIPLKARKPKGSRGTCSFAGCDRSVHAYNLCVAHNEQRRRGCELKDLGIKTWSVAERVEKYVRPFANGCWEWEGARSGGGYGQLEVDGRNVKAHRFMYEMRHGRKLQSFETLDHLCRNRACCNPDHLDVVTQRENTKRMYAFQSLAGEIEHLRSELAKAAEDNERLRAELARVTGGHDVENVRRAVVAPRVQMH